MKKVVSLLLSCSLMLSAAFTGCSSSSPSNSTSKASDQKVTVNFWHVYSENFGAPVIREAVQKFNAEHKDILVKDTYNANMYPGLMQNLQAEVAAGQSPSIVMIGYNYLKYFASNFQYVQPNDIINKIPADKDYLSSNYLDNILNLAKVDGKQIGMPYAISTPMLYYNADLFKKAGLNPDNPPATWEDVQKDAKAITEKTKNYGFYMQEYSDNWAMQGMLESNGAHIMTDGKASFFSQPAVDAYQMLANMVKDKSALHITADEGIQSFINGKVGILFGTSAKIGTIQKGAKFKLVGAKAPGFKNKETRIPAGGNFLSIMAKGDSEQKASWEFIKFLMQPEWLAKWSENTGYLPPRKGVAEDPKGLKSYIESNPLMGINFGQMASIQPWVAFPNDVGVKAEKIFADTRDKILGGEATPSTALKSAQDQINQLLQ